MIEYCFWVFIVSAGILIIYYLLTAFAISAYKKPKNNGSAAPGISIIIAAKNEYDNLQILIPAILKQDYPTFEIIVADDKSTDQTYEYGIDLMQTEKRFKLLRIDNTPDHIHNKKYAITLGIKAARYEHILLTDADCVPAGDRWIREMSAAFTDEQIVLVPGFSQYFKETGFLNRFIRYETLLGAHSYFGLGLLGKPYMGVGRNLAYRKSFFLSKNGFGKFQKIVGGDDDLFVNAYSNRKNTGFVLGPESTVFSYPKKSWGEFFRQKTRHLSTGKFYKASDRFILGLISLVRILFWLALPCAVFNDSKLLYTGIGFFTAMASFVYSLNALKKKSGDESPVWDLPFLDFTYIFYYLSIGLKVLFTKKIKWN